MIENVILQEFCQNLKLSEATQNYLRSHDFEVADCCPLYLTPEGYQPFLRLLKESTALEPDFAQVAARIAETPELWSLGKFMHRLWFDSPEVTFFDPAQPTAKALLGEDSGIFDFMIALSAVPRYFETFRNLNLPQSYALDCVDWLNGALTEYRAGHAGRNGFGVKKTFWMRHYIDGRLFRLGRLEFMVQEYPDKFPTFFRRKGSSEIVGLAPATWRIDREGLVAFPDDENACPVEYEYNSEARTVSGVPIDPRGRVVDATRRITLALDEWESVVKPGEWVPGFHIPGGGGMSREACRDSFILAKDFFRRYFGREVHHFCCSSWIFNPAWERLCPKSNLADFLRQGYGFPLPSHGRDGLVFVFGDDSQQYERYPANNSLERAFHTLHEQNIPLRSGGFFLEAGGLAEYGTEFYRRTMTLGSAPKDNA